MLTRFKITEVNNGYMITPSDEDHSGYAPNLIVYFENAEELGKAIETLKIAWEDRRR